MTIEAIVLAAGSGKRTKTTTPKALLPLAGRPMLEHLLQRLRSLGRVRISVVIGDHGDQIKAACKEFPEPLRWVRQERQLGTGDAMACALKGLRGNAIVLGLTADAPLIGRAAMLRLARVALPGNLALLTTQAANPKGYGRIVRDPQDKIEAIVEEADCTQKQRQIDEVNTGMLAAPLAWLGKHISLLECNNAQSEYYLTDIVAIARAKGVAVNSVCIDEQQAMGVNTLSELARAERYLQRQYAEKLMGLGVRLADPDRLDIRGDVRVASDVFIDANVALTGQVKIAKGARIGYGCVIGDSTIGANAEIKPYSVLEGAKVADACIVGPFARLRAGSVLESKARIGNFVEVKNTRLGRESKANHLCYLGDANIGSGVNIGAGTITCNYDGKNKHKTQINDGAFIGSNTALVAPVSVGENAVIGAGSTITENVPSASLGLGRMRQRNIPDRGRALSSKQGQKKEQQKPQQQKPQQQKPQQQKPQQQKNTGQKKLRAKAKNQRGT